MCHGIQWSVKVQVKSKEFADYLQVFLQPELKCDSCEVTADIRLLNEDKSSTMSKSFTHTFSKPAPAGFTDFIEMFLLQGPESGFINENGEIQLEIRLKVADKPLVEI